MSVQHMDIRRLRLGAGWKPATSMHKYILSYYHREKRFALTTKNTVLDQKRQRGGHVQFLWHLDVTWRIWTSSPSGTSSGHIVVHMVFASPPHIRERPYRGKKLWTNIRSVEPGVTQPLTLTRSYIMMEVPTETWGRVFDVIKTIRGAPSGADHAILFTPPTAGVRGWHVYSFPELRSVLSAYHARMMAGEDTILAAWIRAWAKGVCTRMMFVDGARVCVLTLIILSTGIKTETDPWYVKFCDLCEVVINDYLKEVSDKKGYWAVAECASCARKTAWHKRSGMRFLLEDFDACGNPKPGCTPHYYCSELRHLMRKYHNNRFILTVLQRLSQAGGEDRWHVSPPCGTCVCCRHGDRPVRPVRRQLDY